MARWIFVVTANSKDPAREKEFNKWYETIHIPDVLETPGILRAERYQMKDPATGKGKYMAVYQIESDNIDKTMATLMEIVGKKKAEGRGSDILQVVDRGLYQQIFESKK